jgi:hypothetical protein
MANYDVMPHPAGGWQAKRAGASRASSRHENQAAAQKAATKYARRDGGEVRIHGADGKLRNSNTIGKPDPFPPRDRLH